MASLLLFGVFFIPLEANASILSSLFGGGKVYADVDPSSTNTVTPPGIGSNSQNSELSLQANVSSISVLSNKKDKSTDNADTTPDPNTDTTVADNALVPATGALGVSDGTNASDPSNQDTSVYVVHAGDNISQIATMFGVSVNTILWANDLKKGDKLVAGEVLFILPISGIEHTVIKGQTVDSIAKLYKADPLEIARYNGITEDEKLAIGDKLIVPDAVRSDEGDKPLVNVNASIAKDKKYYESHSIRNLAGYFIDPVPGYRLSQGLHDNNAVDLAIAKGTPIHAAAEGVVTLARTGYNGGFGNLVIISHPNGTETLYAHQSKISAYTGEQVFQGQVIGYVGSTGHSTGPHLHFEVHGARNPGADNSWKY